MTRNEKKTKLQPLLGIQNWKASGTMSHAKKGAKSIRYFQNFVEAPSGDAAGHSIQRGQLQPQKIWVEVHYGHCSHWQPWKTLQTIKKRIRRPLQRKSALKH